MFVDDPCIGIWIFVDKLSYSELFHKFMLEVKFKCNDMKIKYKNTCQTILDEVCNINVLVNDILQIINIMKCQDDLPV